PVDTLVRPQRLPSARMNRATPASSAVQRDTLALPFRAAPEMRPSALRVPPVSDRRVAVAIRQSLSPSAAVDRHRASGARLDAPRADRVNGPDAPARQAVPAAADRACERGRHPLR